MARIGIQLVKKGRGVEGFIIDANKKIERLREALTMIGVEAAEHMKNTISSSSKHGEGKLGNAIKVDKFADGVGVGKIDDLPLYWYVLNYGKTKAGKTFIPPANRGHFQGAAPNSLMQATGGGSEKWVHTGNRGDYLLKPKSFTPITYIEQMKAWMNDNFRSRINALTKVVE